MKITLPPLPTARLTALSPEDIRARDLEVARVVLEAAARVCERHSHSIYADRASDCKVSIRALEVSHD